TGVLDRLIHSAILDNASNDVLRDVPRRDRRPRDAIEENLHRFGNAKPPEAVLEAERGHGVVADTGRKNPQRAVDRRMRIAADDDLAGRPESALNDGVMHAACAAIEDMAD